MHDPWTWTMVWGLPEGWWGLGRWEKAGVGEEWDNYGINNKIKFQKSPLNLSAEILSEKYKSMASIYS